MTRKAPHPELPHEFDLPPRWDGFTVEWEGWAMPAPAFICPPPREPDRCLQCRSTAPQQMNVGRCGDDERTVLLVLSARRCPDCDLDTVIELGRDGVWTLDATDYGEEGSAA